MTAFESRKRAADPFKTNPLNVPLPFSFIDFYRKNSVKDGVVFYYLPASFIYVDAHCSSFSKQVVSDGKVNRSRVGYLTWQMAPFFVGEPETHEC